MKSGCNSQFGMDVGVHFIDTKLNAEAMFNGR
jgi:hypothetical protein